MSYDNWKDKISEFKVKDVRGLSGNFFPALKKLAMKIEKDNGLEVIQTSKIGRASCRERV